ncbi:DEAD/DEAH box helicase [Desulfotalea psychrophila]|uniref:Probable helicase n=1 Tax=Desulfotalea psychrophila (strain LSv54 / DSM 12343) TaxID=177439 RepID=Q6APK0_DESPS|nr:DEAD/DEAH box helicase [Desulfotalea psychrophila]CAG35724.1 probable helicase [Desulfotalea psychrophila LSv54]
MSTQTDLFAQYDKLSSFEQSLLKFLSIVYEPAHTTLIVNCLRKLELKNARGSKPTAANLNHYFNKFEEFGLITAERQCVAEMVETLSKMCIAEDVFDLYAKTIREEAPVSYYYGKWSTRCWRALREMRIGIYTQDFDLIDEASEFLSTQCKEIVPAEPPTVRVIAHPFDADWFRGIPASFQFYLLSTVLQYAQASLSDYPEIHNFISSSEELEHLTDDEKIPFRRLLATQLLMQARSEEAELLVADHTDSFQGTGALGSALFLQGKTDEALQAFENDLQFLRKLSGSEQAAIFGPFGLFHILCLLSAKGKEGFTETASQIGTALSLFAGSAETDSYNFLATVLNSHLNNHNQDDEVAISDESDPTALTLVFAGLCQYWLNSTISPELEQELRNLHDKATLSEYNFFSIVLREILTETKADVEEGKELAEETVNQLETVGQLPKLLPLLKAEEPWRRSLQALISATVTANANDPSQEIRLAWMVATGEKKKKDGKEISLTPREQKLTSSGHWSKGRPMSLSRLYQNTKLTYLTPQDRKICATIKKNYNPETHSTSYSLDRDKTLLALVSHPHLFLANSPTTPVEFVEGEPELLVEERGENLHIRFAQPVSSDNVNYHFETPTRVKVIAINENHRRIGQITGKDGMTVPLSASDQVLTAIGNISSFMTVHSAIAADISQHNHNVTIVEADSSIYMHLIPYGSGFRLEMFVKPFKDGDHYLKPGQGVENIMAEVKGKRLQTKRDLSQEEHKARDIEELCPILDLAVDLEQDNDREWHLQDPDDCLQALTELQAIQDKIIIEWPEGEKLTIAHQISPSNLNLKIRTNRQNWFAMSGEIVIDQDHVIELKDLLVKLKKGSSRFVEIGNGQFIALTQEFKKRLEEMSVFGDDIEGDGNEILIHPLAALPLEKLAEHANTFADQGWKKQLTDIKDVQNYQPVLPTTLQAELRDYQLEGFSWLGRLAHWGVGGCLADDMGLGKTLQSLALILTLSENGPTLVVAPTSVANNWRAEVKKFTPTLKLKVLAHGDRKKTIEDLGSHDLLITTYTLLQQESELLSGVDWQTVVLDEAQAIKNAATKRSKAAMGLKAKFKLITTGTPIENHLGELWNLLHFVNPGLLGTLQSFNENFAIPIERYQDREARTKLKKLIRPFILRRIKSEVLDELPPRTEITLEVQMSEEERHFYEALRQNALDILEGNKDRKGRHLQILTEIMKLRQACCNPRLIDKNTSISSSKMKVFGDVVEELLGGNHKALVFSQFIGHLHIIREYLDERGISYQYLDGSTSSKMREKGVNDFQAGKGDLFLISLKAGGLGLNLTAADYVLHMDPWWNPAIEDQASDRAHRIGQTRPVTVYRLVSKNSIEEKIVKLHQEKRDLAGSLLEGTDISAKMSSDDLLDLIRSDD